MLPNQLDFRSHDTSNFQYSLKYEWHFTLIDTLHIVIHQVMVGDTVELLLEERLGFLPLVQVVDLARTGEDLLNFLEILLFTGDLGVYVDSSWYH